MSDAASRIAAFGLPSQHRLPESTLSRQAFASLLEECERQRVLGLLASAVRESALPVDDAQHDDLERLFQAWLAHDVRLERLLFDAVAALGNASIPVRVLKGAALAHTAYPDPAYRVFGDIDLLVPTSAFSRAVMILSDELGAAREIPELRPGFDERFGKEVLLRNLCDLELDLHRTFVEGALGLTVDVDALFSDSRRFVLAGHELETLSASHQFIHACYAATLGDWPPRLGALRDVAQQMLCVAAPPRDEVLETARRWRAEAVVAHAVTTACRALALVDSAPIVQWAHTYRAAPMDRFLLSAHRGGGRAYTRHVAALIVIPGVRSKLAYLRAITFPQRAYLEARQLTAGRHAGRALRAVLRTNRR
jgi:hypothetical protein